jgi:hypothetical protein
MEEMRRDNKMSGTSESREAKMVLQHGYFSTPMSSTTSPVAASTASLQSPLHRVSTRSSRERKKYREQLTNKHRQTLQAQQAQYPAAPAQWPSLAVKIRLQLIHARKLLHLLGRVWWVAHVHQALEPGRRGSYRAAMGKDVERGLAAVCTLARCADAAKGERGDRGVEEAIVHRGAAGARLVEDLLELFLVAKGVGAEGRVVRLIGHADGLVQVCDGQDGQQRAEALVADEAVLDGADLDDGGLDEEVRLVHGAADDNLAVAGVEHLLQALELLLVDDAAVVGRVAGAVGVEVAEGVLHLLDKGGHHVAVDEGAVLADADLARVQRLGPQEAAGGEPGVGMLGDDGGVAAAQLQNQRRERLGRLLRDDAGDDLGARVEDGVPLLVEQRRGLGDGALHDGVARRVEGLGENLLQHGSGKGRRLGRLDDGGAARGDGANERTHGQLEGEVVGADDERGAEGVFADAWADKLVGEGDVGGLLVLCKARQVVGHPHAVVHAPRDLDQVRLERRLAQVAAAGLGDERLIVLEGPVQLAQLLDAEREGARLVGEERGAHARARGGDVADGRVLKGGELGHCRHVQRDE